MKKRNGVKFTIVITTYNIAGTVERAIQSVLNQTYQNRELIVMDAGSTDGTVAVIEKYADRLKYWVSESDRGPSDAISKALPYADGDLIGYLGGDDWYEPYALELVAKAYEGTEADLYYGNMAVHVGDEVQIKDLSKFCPDRLYQDGTQYLGAVCAFTKKELLEWNYKRENDVLHTDYLFFLRLFAENKKFAHIGSDKAITNFSIGGRTTRKDFFAYRGVKKLRDQFKREYPQIGVSYSKCDELLEKEYAIGMMSYYRKILGVEDYRSNGIEIRIAGDRCILFGAGDNGVDFARELDILGTMKIECFVDNDDRKWGKYIAGIEVKSPEILSNTEGKCIIVTPAPKYEMQIMEQLHRAGVDKRNQVISYAGIAVRLYNMLGEEVIEDALHRGIIAV